MFSKAARVQVRKFHRWAGILIGIQLLLWITSGVYFAWVPIQVIRDDDRKTESAVSALPLNQVVPASTLKIPANFVTKTLRLEQAPAGLFYRLESTAGAVAVFDALTGEPGPQLSSERAIQFAMQQIQSQDKPSQVQLLETRTEDYKGPIPVYQILLPDVRGTRLYVDPWSGRVLARRNMFWRVYDFLWMLHIMDFKEREDFNNPWLKGLSLGALGLWLSGYFLIGLGRAPRRKHPA
ncbi:PepSY domain-containing protein [Oligoflexus tunisiensis]|uniref:PepSY domain-containing protein n=1 Tax=Oligoflexus tunisiensis TaxID=708132 RepID=UPI00114CF7C4|nr:PepSY domain-containing protein [Oligoflexus tunisiensis]